MLTKQDVLISSRGEVVVFELGNYKVSFEFQVALEVSALLRREARYAKLSAGHDTFKHSVMGILHDASAPKKKESRWGRVLPERLAKRDISVCAEGQIVKWRMGRTTQNLDYRGAQFISQAFRIHGKLARNNAGEKAHWTDLIGNG